MTTATIDKSIDVDCPRRAAFEKLSSVDTFVQLRSRFTGAEQIQARGPNTAHVVELVEGHRAEFDIEFAPVPEERIDYHIPGAAPMDVTLTLRQVDEEHTALHMHAEYDPQKLSDVYHLNQQEIDQHLQQRLENMKSALEGEAT